MRRTAILCALLMLAGCTAHPATTATPSPSPSPSPSTGHLGDAVPWLDEPTDLPTVGPAPVRPTARPCTGADLSATAELRWQDGAGGMTLYSVGIRNAGRGRCSLGGYPVLLSAGRTVPVQLGDGRLGNLDDQERPATLDPGEQAAFMLGTSVQCGTGGDGRTYRDISLQLLGRKLPLPDVTLSGTCPVSVGELHRDRAEVAPPPQRYAVLTARIDAPAQVAPDTDLDYTVTLTNPGTAPLALDPCPVYRQMLWKAGGVYRLNCGPEVIPAGGSVRFAMRLHIPDFVPAEQFELEWAITEASGVGPTATATVRVG
ncbi:DUF4232 domain-containing protein [Catellatospora tritici]|uniref:DUF4232 domain-containing protein n=1 Tax=Catellatospora tritici TaxID=2851566 RepID=UPI001C2CFFC8|nr:DUF4232 domain-containing protein [Catellatospora tritici]MBV1851789.1 DUF4232 domain-containing protein [Catellatospora tritici]